MTSDRSADATGSPQTGVPAQPHDVSLVQEFDLNSLYALRAAVSAHAVTLGLPEERLGTIVLIATELATNAIRHGAGTGRLRLWRSDQTVHLQVSDDGPGMAQPDKAGRRPAPLSSPGGRGLWIVRQVSDRLDIAADHGTTVTVGLNIEGT
jgi:anti-sigma regulatory factor (Ser/Thr protein kinase)